MTMPTPDDRVELHPGMEVVSSDDEKLGKVVALDQSQLTVEKGFFFPTDYYVPLSAVDSADDDTIYLNLTKDAALNQRWTATPEIDPGAMNAAAAVTEPPAATSGTADQTAITGTGLTQDAVTAEPLAGGADADTLRVPVYEEELTATTRPVEAGAVQINKDVVTEERSLDVPITEERVRVTRRAVDRDATGTLGADAFTEGTLDVPVRREAVDVQKRVRAAEEVDITREPVQTTQTVTGAVRREVVNVEDHTDVDVTDGTTGTTAAGSSS